MVELESVPVTEGQWTVGYRGDDGFHYVAAIDVHPDGYHRVYDVDTILTSPAGTADLEATHFDSLDQALDALRVWHKQLESPR